MDNLSINLQDSEKEILSHQVSDEALEIAAGTAKEGAGSLTVAFCTGLDTCPA
ncbi:MAG TPA: hypothetical protein VHU22_20960 [Xanthobacteraceae bacterium]|jgi:hypothetical protein|nr:hypothetical protein [Xanthobacteraceae bacterium]